MIFDLPCRLGEEFVSLKFVDWVDGERVYTKDKTLTLNGFGKGLLQETVCFGYKNEKVEAILSFSEEFGKDYNATHFVFIDDKYFEWMSVKLSDWGFPCERTGELIGLKLLDGYEVAEFCIEPRYEHVCFAIHEIMYNTFDYTPLFDSEKEAQRAKEQKEKLELQAKKISGTFARREEIAATDEEKDEILKLIISEAEKIGLKLRKLDIVKENIRAVYWDDELKKFSYIMDFKTLGERAKKLSRRLNTDNMTIFSHSIHFIFNKKC